MAGNTFGQLFTVTTFGESHGAGLGCIIDGCPPGLALTESDIQADLDRRKPGTSRHVTQRREADQVEILSGVFEGKTTGTPIALLIRNTDQRSKDYGNIATSFRPGHADYTYWHKYGTRDYRGGGRSSARETAARVAAATAARNLLRATLGVEVFSHVVSIGRSNPYDGPEPTFDDLGAIDASPVRANTATPEGQAAEASMIAEIEAAKKAGDTLGGIVEVIVSGLPIGLGSHVSGDDRLDAQLAAALMSIQAIKGVEIGDGFAEARRRGSEAHDEIIRSGHTLTRTTNRAGGLEGGMTNGETLRVRAAMKPISTVPRALKSVDMATGKPATGIHQRSDVCAVPAAGVVAEAMVALVVARAVLQKFGGDSLGETKRNIAAYQEHVARRVQFPDDVN